MQIDRQVLRTSVGSNGTGRKEGRCCKERSGVNTYSVSRRGGAFKDEDDCSVNGLSVSQEDPSLSGMYASNSPS